jgi:hypothetical protein
VTSATFLLSVSYLLRCSTSLTRSRLEDEAAEEEAEAVAEAIVASVVAVVVEIVEVAAGFLHAVAEIVVAVAVDEEVEVSPRAEVAEVEAAVSE